MTVPLPPGKTADDVVELVISNALRGIVDEQTQRDLAATFQFSDEDAALARDRAFGGIVRAATGSAQNCPDATKDPIAFAAFQRATRDRSISRRIYPQFDRSVGPGE